MGPPMFQIVFQRLLHPTRRFASAGLKAEGSARARLEVYPPALRRPSIATECASWREHLGRWIETAWPGSLMATRQADSSKVRAGAAPLASVRHEFARSLSDIRTQQAGATLNRIRLARSLHELWHLRPEVFNLVSRHDDQAEADRRLALLNRHFPTRAPRSAFGALASRDGES